MINKGTTLAYNLSFIDKKTSILKDSEFDHLPFNTTYCL